MSIPLAIVGCGKMGRLVEQLAPEYGFDVREKFSRSNITSLSRDSLHGASLAIEFTAPAAASQNLPRLAALGVNTVCGTTGWYEGLPRIRQVIRDADTALVYGANFAVGMNLFFEIVTRAAALFAQHPEYEAWGWEIHHSAKKDAPSGTLLALVEEMKHAGYAQPVDTGSNRAGANPGTHEIGFDSAADTITLRHTARSREGFARGALKAAQWVMGKRGLHEFGEVIFAGDAKTARRSSD